MRAIYFRRIRHYFSATDFKELEKKAGSNQGMTLLTNPEAYYFCWLKKNIRKNTCY